MNAADDTGKFGDPHSALPRRFPLCRLNRAVNGGAEPAARRSLMAGSVFAALPNLIAVACGFIMRLASAAAACRLQRGSAHLSSNQDAPNRTLTAKLAISPAHPSNRRTSAEAGIRSGVLAQK